MDALPRRKPAAAAHAGGGAKARPRAGVDDDGERDAPLSPPGLALLAPAPANDASAAPAAGSQAAQAPAGSGASGAAVAGASGGAAVAGEQDTAAVSAASAAAKTHKSVEGWAELPASKLPGMDGAFALAAQCTAEAAATSDPARRKVQTGVAVYYGRIPALTVSEHTRVKSMKTTKTEGKKLLKFPRPDLKAAVGLPVPERVVGAVPGVYVNDLFATRIAARLTGVMTHHMNGIDHMLVDGRPVAIAIAHSGGYADDQADASFETLSYTGEGSCDGLGNKQQKADQDVNLPGNRALAGAAELASSGHTVRVLVKVHCSDKYPRCIQGRSQFLYCGLYSVESFGTENGSNGYLICRAKLQRVAEQASLSPAALELLSTALHTARETAAKAKLKRSAAAAGDAGAANDAEKGGDGAGAVKAEDEAAAVARPARKRARRLPAPCAVPEGEGADEGALLKLDKTRLQVLVRGCAAAVEAAGGACSVNLATLLAQKKPGLLAFVLERRSEAWGAMTAAQLAVAAEEAYQKGQLAGDGRVADEAATTTLLLLLKAGPPAIDAEAATVAPARKAPAKRQRAPRRKSQAPRRRRRAIESDDDDDDDGDDDGDGDAAQADAAPAAVVNVAKLAPLDTLSHTAILVLCEALPLGAGWLSQEPTAKLLERIRAARTNQWACLTELRLAALVRRASGGDEDDDGEDTRKAWRDAISDGIKAAAAAADRRRAGPAQVFIDAPSLPSSDDEEEQGGAKSDPDFSASEGCGRGLDDDDDDEEELSEVESEEEAPRGRRSQRRQLPIARPRRVGGRFAARRKRSPSSSPEPSASPPPPPSRRASKAKAPPAAAAARRPMPVQQPQPAEPMAAAAGGSTGAAASTPAPQPAAAAASTPAAPAAAAFVPKPEEQKPALAAAAQLSPSAQLRGRILDFDATQTDPLTEDELFELIQRFTPPEPPPPPHTTPKAVAEVALAHQLAASMDATALAVLQEMEAYASRPNLLVKFLLRPKFLKKRS